MDEIASALEFGVQDVAEWATDELEGSGDRSVIAIYNSDVVVRELAARGDDIATVARLEVTAEWVAGRARSGWHTGRPFGRSLPISRPRKNSSGQCVC